MQPDNSGAAPDKELLQTIHILQTMNVSGQLQYATQFDSVRAFCLAARGKGVSFVGDMVKVVPTEVMATRLRVIDEEINKELIPLLQHMIEAGSYSLEQQTELLDHIVDSVFVLLGLAVNFGLPFDSAFQIVTESNMQKVVRPGGPVFREDGKVLKPEGWEPPTKALFNLVLQAHKVANKEKLEKLAKATARPENPEGQNSLMSEVEKPTNDATVPATQV